MSHLRTDRKQKSGDNMQNVKNQGFFSVFILQWNPTLVASPFKGYPQLRDNTVWSRILSGFSNVQKSLFKVPLFRGYSDLRDKFLKVSLILGKFRFWENFAL